MMMKEGDTFEHIYCVSEKVYKGFIDIFNDRNPLHTDEDFAQQKSFKGKVMHGAILAGFISHFIGEQLPVKNVIVQSYRLNFQKPVYLEDELRFHAVIAGYYESVHSYEFKYSFTNALDQQVAKGTINISLI